MKKTLSALAMISACSLITLNAFAGSPQALEIDNNSAETSVMGLTLPVFGFQCSTSKFLQNFAPTLKGYTDAGQTNQVDLKNVTLLCKTNCTIAIYADNSNPHKTGNDVGCDNQIATATVNWNNSNPVSFSNVSPRFSLADKTDGSTLTITIKDK